MQLPSPLPGPLKKRIFHPKDFLYLPEYINFSRLKKKFLILFWKNVLHLSEKSKFSKRKQFLIINGKAIFQTKNFLYLSEKLTSNTYLTVFNKLIRAQAKNISHEKVLFFHILEWLFLYSTSLCFSFSERVLYCQRPY